MSVPDLFTVDDLADAAADRRALVKLSESDR